MKILITGANGFVGRNLVETLKPMHDLRLAQRRVEAQPWETVKLDLSEPCDFSSALSGVDVVIHTAAVVHQMESSKAPSATTYYSVNTMATEQLAVAARNSGVKHFVFLSSIKVYGEGSSEGKIFTRDDALAPRSDYARSKSRAEAALLSLSQEGDMVVSIVRPPLIYGPGVKANFAELVALSKYLKIFPLPPRIGKRSLVSIWNLCDLIGTLVHKMPQKSDIYLVSDGSDCTVYELLQFIAASRNSFVVGLPTPACIIRFVLKILGRDSVYKKIFGELRLDIEHTKNILSWEPIHDTREGLKRLVSSSVFVE